MGTKINVPVFDEQVDPTDPSDALGKVGGMIGGVLIGLIVLAIGTFGFERLADVAGQEDADAGIPVAGGD